MAPEFTPSFPESPAAPVYTEEQWAGPLVGSVNAATGEIETRPMTEDEIASLPIPVIAPPPPAQLSREAFCVALIGAGILTEAEAIDAALGAWPPKFEPALQGKPLVEQLTIKNLWRETKTVARDAALFLDLLEFYAAQMKLTKAQAAALGDAIFAVSA